MNTLVLLTSSMLLSGGFDSWDFLKENEKYGIKPETIEKLREIPGFKVWYGDGNWMTFSVPKKNIH